VEGIEIICAEGEYYCGFDEKICEVGSVTRENQCGVAPNRHVFREWG